MLKKRSWYCVVFLLLGTYSLSAQVRNIADISADSSITIGKIYLLGNNKTRSEIILRELDIKEGKELKLMDFAQMLVLDQQKLTNTRLFVVVEIIPLFLSNKNVDVLIRLQERWYIFPLPIFKLADRNFTEWWVNQNRDFSRVNYGAQLIHTNLTGRNDRMRLRMQFGFAQQFTASYNLPYINKEQTLGIGFNTSYTTNKTVGYNTRGHRLQFIESDDVIRRAFSASTTLTYRPSFYSRHSFNLGYSRTFVNDTITTLNAYYHVNNQNIQKYLRFTYSFTVDRRDYIAYPLNGSIFNFQLNQFGLGVFNDISMLTSRLSYAKYSDLKNKFYLANRFEVYNNFAGSIPYITRAGFGYRPDFIRGYERFVVESGMLLSHRSSLRFKVLKGTQQLNRRSMIDQFRTLPYAFYLKVFLDAGYAGDPLSSTENNFFNNEWIGSVGIGIDIVTYYDFVFRLEYSVNREGTTGFFFNFRSAL